MESWGGHNNGTTSNDRTNYYEIGPRNLLETFLWLEADRLATLSDVITDEELERQRKVVQNERRQSYENRPYGRGDLAIPEAMYAADHPYHWPTIGSHEDIEAATVADVRAFFQRFYRPSNASLAIAGDFDPAEARALVEKYFGWQPKLPAPARPPRPEQPRLARDIRIALTDRVQLPRLRLSWHSAGAVRTRRRRPGHGGARPGRRQVQPPVPIARVRKADRAGRVRLSELAAARQHVPGRRDRETRPRPRRDERRRHRGDRAPGAEGPTEAELARARNTHLADFYKSLDHLQTRADLLNHYQHVLGDPDGVARDVGRYEKTTWRRCARPSRASSANRHLDLRISPEPAAPNPVTA
jgi:predicted Zn-dependent peptidase